MFSKHLQKCINYYYETCLKTFWLHFYIHVWLENILMLATPGLRIIIGLLCSRTKVIIIITIYVVYRDSITYIISAIIQTTHIF